MNQTDVSSVVRFCHRCAAAGLRAATKQILPCEGQIFSNQYIPTFGIKKRRIEKRERKRVRIDFYHEKRRLEK